MTSKYVKELEDSFKTIGDVKRYTKDIINDGTELAFKEIHDVKSFERLKKVIQGS